LAEEDLSTASKEVGRRSLDLDVSAVLIAERLIGEILS
jgi:hypothetical protein